MLFFNHIIFTNHPQSFIWLKTQITGLKCQICTSESCRGQRTYMTEECPLGAKFCYTLAGGSGVGMIFFGIF